MENKHSLNFVNNARDTTKLFALKEVGIRHFWFSFELHAKITKAWQWKVQAKNQPPLFRELFHGFREFELTISRKTY